LALSRLGCFQQPVFAASDAALQARLTAEFERRAQTEAEKRLELMKARQWEEYAGAKAKALATNLRNVLMQLQGRWWFTCDRCDRRVAIDLSPSNIASLLRGEAIDIACGSCLDPAPFPFILSTVRHKVVSLSLGGLLALYMGSSPP